MSKLTAIIQLCVFSLVLLAFGAIAANPATPGKIIGATHTELPDWFKESFLEIAEDVDEASEAGKHVLLFFHLDDCPYCSKMVEENFKNAPYTQTLQQRFDVIEINIRGDREVIFSDDVNLTEKDLARHLKVRYTPTVLFLSPANEPVLRLNGYRSVAAFKHALDYVHEKAYRHTNLSAYIETRAESAVYTLRDHPSFVVADDLSRLPDKPLLVLFEDRTCDECDALHDGVLARHDTHELLSRYTAVRLDALSEQKLVAPDGTKTTPKAFAAALGLSYRPGIILFDHGKEILRIDGLLYRYHFQERLRYVGERHYQQYPQFRDFSQDREQAILNSGQDINVGE